MKYLILLALSSNAFAVRMDAQNLKTMDDYAAIFCENSKVKNCEAKHRVCARRYLNQDDPKKDYEINTKCLKEFGLL